MKTIKFLLLAALMLTYTISTYGQDKSHYMPKFAIKTNALYWATTTANLGFEVGLSKKLTLDISGNYNPWKFSDHKQIKHWLVQPELRYWLCERFYGHFFGLHAHYAEANVSNLNILGLGHERYQGHISSDFATHTIFESGKCGLCPFTHRNDNLFIGYIRYISCCINTLHGSAAIFVGQDFAHTVRFYQILE